MGGCADRRAGGSVPSEKRIRFSSVFITESALLLPSVSVLIDLVYEKW